MVLNKLSISISLLVAIFNISGGGGTSIQYSSMRYFLASALNRRPIEFQLYVFIEQIN